MQAAVLSAIRYVIVAIGSAYAAKKGLDPATVESIASAVVALGAAVWGVVLRLKDK